jgi:hypothetical protein
VEAVAAPGAGQPDAASPWMPGQALLGGDGRTVEDRVGIVEFGNDLGRVGLARRVERDDDRRREGQGLQAC